jgi:fructoselysine-6-P-deglycase FrlB-like protein
VKSLLSHAGDIVFVACGSSFWLSLSAHKTLAYLTGRRAFAVKAGDVLMNFEEHRAAYTNPILVCPSRSGRSTEQLEVIKLFRQAYGEVPVLSAVIYDDSEMEKLSQVCLRLPWANEITVCQTRSFNCLYLAMLAVAAVLSGNREFLAGITKFADASADMFSRGMQLAEKITKGFPEFSHLVVIGSGRQYGVAIEAAYIGIEMAQLNANYYAVMELRHGPIVTVTEKTLVALLSNGTSRKLEENMARDARKQGGKVLAVVAEGGFDNADWVVETGELPAEAVALCFVQVLQAFAYWQAVEHRLDPDHPGDLVPYITIK